MTLFHILQFIVISYFILVSVFALSTLAFEIKNGFKTVTAKRDLFYYLNGLHGKRTILTICQIYSYTFLAAWLLFAAPLIDMFIGTNWISSSSFTELTSYLGTLSGEQFNYYFITVFFTSVGAKGFLVVKRMADVLKTDTLAVGVTGQWGARSEFRTSN